MSAPPDKSKALGRPANDGRNTWVQTERAAHEAWGRLSMRKPRAAAVLHHLIANMGHQNAVVVPQKTLARMVGCNERTVRRALDDLVAERWVQVVQLGHAGTVNAYVVNAAVAWGERRESIGRLALFNARVIADADDQAVGTLLDRADLRRIPALYPDEQQLPVGPGEPPPSEPSLPGLEADLPTRSR